MKKVAAVVSVDWETGRVTCSTFTAVVVAEEYAAELCDGNPRYSVVVVDRGGERGGEG